MLKKILKITGIVLAAFLLIVVGYYAKVYISTENPLVFSAFDLWDPEMGRRGLRYPPNRRFNVGIQLAL